MSLTLSTVFLMLAMHPEVQSKIYDETCHFFISSEIFESLNGSFTYLDMVINETLRLFSPVPFLLRETGHENFTNQMKIPQNSIVGFSLINFSRDKEIWGSDADLFRPERFCKQNLNKNQKNAFMPFGCEFLKTLN